jgi:chromosome segregation ATPase
VKEIPSETVREALQWLLEAPNEPGEREFHANALPPAAYALIASAAETARASRAGSGASQADLAALLRELDASEADRTERLRVIEAQGKEISRLEAEAHRWEQEAASLWPRLNEAINARNLLEATLANSEQDRAARQEVIDRLGNEMARLHAEVDLWLRQAGELQARAAALATERDELAFQASDLRGHFAASEADRAARLEVIERQGEEIGRLHAQIDRLVREMGELRKDFAASEADRAARLEVIHNLERRVAELPTVHKQLGAANEALSASEQRAQTAEDALAAAMRRQKRIDRHWMVRLLRKLRLWIN